jgi:hypothetical protein
MNYDKPQQVVEKLEYILKNFPPPRKTILEKALLKIKQAKYTTGSMIDLEYDIWEIIEKENKKYRKKNEELLKNFSELYEIISDPEEWCL